MNIYPYTLFLATITSLFLGFFTLSKNKPFKLFNFLWAMVCFGACAWSYSFGMLCISTTPSAGYFWSVTLHIGPFFIPVLLLHFSAKAIQKPETIILRLGYLIACFFTLLSILAPRLFVSSAQPKLNFFFYPSAGPLYIYWIIYYMAYNLYASFILLRLLRTNISAQKKNQLKYILLTIFLGPFCGATTFPLIYNIKMPPVGVPFVFLYTIFTTYSIFRHNLLDINIFIRKTIFYSVLVTIITILYLGIVLILENFLRGYYGYTSFFLCLSIIIFFLLIFQPLKNKIQYILDKYFFHGSIAQIDEENLRLRNELQKSEKMKAVATLAAGMAHEIKNPLTAIKTFTEHLSTKGTNPEFREKFETIVGKEVDRINYIVKELLEFSKPTELQLKNTDINILLDETLNFLNNDLVKHNIKVEKNYATLPLIQVDPNQMKQVFLNLFLNAIDAMPGGGALTIRTRDDRSQSSLGRGTRDDHTVSISIHDTGKGIAKEDLKHIFDPFFTKKDGGTGLGLSVVHGIIEKHGGKITVSSKVGAGTEFVIML